MTNLQKLELKVKVHNRLKDMLQECIADMVNIGIPVQTDKIEGIYLGKVQDALAICCYNRVDNECVDFNIVISNKIVKYMNDEVVVANVKDSIYHELLHTCENCQNEHNDTWLKYAIICDNKLGTKTRTRLSEKVYLNRVKTEIHTHNCEFCGFEYQTEDNTLLGIRCPICKKEIYKNQN